MEGAEELRFPKAVDSKDMQQQSKALDKLTDRFEDLRFDSSRVRLDMGSVTASKEGDDDESMSESESEGEESDEEEGGQDFFSKPLMKLHREQDELKWNVFLEEYHKNFMRKLRETDD